MNCQKWIWLNSSKCHFQGMKGQTCSDHISLFFAYSFLGMTLINCQEIDLIELFERYFSR